MTQTMQHCPPDDPCSECFDAQHALDHPEIVDGCRACKLDSIQLDARLHARRTTRYVPPRKANNAWERGVAGEHRPGGGFMPYLNRELAPLSVKQFADNRSRNEEQIRRNRAGILPTVNH